MPGHEALDSRLRAGDGNLLLPAGALGEHAQIEACARPGLEVDDDEGVVDDVGLQAILADLVAVIGLGAAGSEHAHGLVPWR